ncbi:PAS domain-containing protein [bacterium]|nr:PAS domain-containing protein [bacterium]
MKGRGIKKTRDWMIVRWMLILRPAIVTATLGMAIITLPQDVINKTPIAIIVLGTYLLTLLYWLSHYMLGTSRPLLAIQISFDIFLITVIIVTINYAAGGYDASFVGFYFLSIMCASLFFRRLYTFFFSLLAIVFFLSSVFVICPFLDPFFIAEDTRNSIILQTFMFSALIIAVGFFSSYFAERVIKKDTALISALKLLKRARLDTTDILQCMTNGLIAVDSSGSIMYMNRAAKRILQIGNAIIEGKRYNGIFGKCSGELVKIIEHGLREPIQPSEMEITISPPKGDPLPIGLTLVTLYDTDGSSRGIIVNFKDLTEKNKLLEMIRQSDRMAAIGELSAAIAHEIKNPLASICSAVELLSESVDTSDPHNIKLMKIIEKESARLQLISADFLQFARIQTPHIQMVDIGAIIEDVLVLIENDPRNTETVIVRNLVNGGTVALFDPDHLKQILINLIINSLENLAGTGEIELAIEDGEYPENEYVRLVVSDTGTGFPKEALGHMFEPFFSTKKEGTGLGLAIVRKMVISNNGRVFAQNRVNGGAEVALDLPLKGAD